MKYCLTVINCQKLIQILRLIVYTLVVCILACCALLVSFGFYFLGCMFIDYGSKLGVSSVHTILLGAIMVVVPVMLALCHLVHDVLCQFLLRFIYKRYDGFPYTDLAVPKIVQNTIRNYYGPPKKTSKRGLLGGATPAKKGTMLGLGRNTGITQSYSVRSRIHRNLFPEATKIRDGIKNHGLTCYVTTVLLILERIESLVNIILEKYKANSGSSTSRKSRIVTVLGQYFEFRRNYPDREYTSQDIMKYIWGLRLDFKPNMQYDPAELLESAFMSKLFSDPRLNSPYGRTLWYPLTYKEMEPVLSSIIETAIECDNCKFESVICAIPQYNMKLYFPENLKVCNNNQIVSHYCHHNKPI